MPSSWSPASWMSSTAQFTHASDPSMTGAPPVAAGCHNTPANLSPPEMANRRHTSRWWSASTLTQKPTRAAALVRALIIKSGKAKFFRCSERTAERATFETQRGDDPPVSLTYTVEEKKADGPIKPGSAWAKSPADMCVARASSKLARLVFPDVVHGLYAHEELENGNG